MLIAFRYITVGENEDSRHSANLIYKGIKVMGRRIIGIIKLPTNDVIADFIQSY